MEPQVVESALAVMHQAEIDSTIATAKAYPRNEEKALKRLRKMATLRVEISEALHFSIPRKGKDGRRVNIQGPSIRFAEMLAATWGNLHVASRVVEVTAKEVVAQGVCLDLESNVRYDIETRRSISSNGRRYSDDMITVTGNAAGAIAQRNAVLKAIPRPLWEPAYQAALDNIGSTTASMADRWQRAMAWFQARGVEPERLKRRIGITKVGELTTEKMQQLVGWRSAIETDGDELEKIFGGEATAKEKPAAKKRPPKRAAPREVKAEETGGFPTIHFNKAPAEPEPEPEAPPATDDEERDRLWQEWTELKTHQFSDDDLQAIREYATVERIHMSGTLEELDAIVIKGRSIIGKRK